VHEGGIRIERLDDGAWRFVHANGESWVSSAPGHTQPMAAQWTDLAARHEQDGIHIDPHTARTHWRGESMDYGLAIDALLGKERRARFATGDSGAGRQ
jgi:hypothetical protein